MGTTPPCLCFPIRKLFIACCDDLKIISELLCGKSKGTGFRSTWVLCRKVTHNSYHPIQLSVNTAVSKSCGILQELEKDSKSEQKKQKPTQSPHSVLTVKVMKIEEDSKQKNMKQKKIEIRIGILIYSTVDC